MPKCFSFKLTWTNPSSESSESSESSDPGLPGQQPGSGASRPRSLEASEPRSLEAWSFEASRLHFFSWECMVQWGRKLHWSIEFGGSGGSRASLYTPGKARGLGGFPRRIYWALALGVMTRRLTSSSPSSGWKGYFQRWIC